MARNQSALVNWSQYLGVRAVTGFMHCFDVEQNLDTAGTVGSMFWRFNRKRRERAEHNLAVSFPDWSSERIRRTAESSMRHMFQLFMVDAFATPRLITPTSWPNYIDLGKLEPVLDRLLRGQRLILVTGHCGNWELLGYALSVIGFPIAALARPLDNPLLDRWLLNIREARGMRILTKWGATPVLQQLLRQNGRIGFIADQNAGDQGLFVPFFGRLASCYKSMGLLAMRYDVPIAAGVARRRDGRLLYQLDCVDIITPDAWVDQPDPLYYITARISRALEMMVRKAPEQYLWLHRRWKSRPKHEREGKPMPARLRARLEALPWMTAAELDRIVELSEHPERVAPP